MGASKAGETKPIGAPPGNLRLFTQKSPRKMRDAFCFFFPFQKHGSDVSMTFEDQKTEKRPSIITSTSWYDKCTISHSLRQVIDLNWFFADFYTPLTEAGMQKEHLSYFAAWFMTGSFQWTVIVSTYFTNTYIHTYITLHYITLHYITLHYITLHYITLH